MIRLRNKSIIFISITFAIFIYSRIFNTSNIVIDQKDKDEIPIKPNNSNNNLINYEYEYEYEVNESQLNNCIKYINDLKNLQLNHIDDTILDETVLKIRNYNHCQLKLNSNKCDINLENKLFPWLNQLNIPNLTSINSKNQIIKIPLIKDDYDVCFFDRLKDNLNGKGIVVDVNKSQINEIISLILTLRRLKTELPVLFIHNGDISEILIKNLSKWSTINFTNLNQIDNDLIKKLNIDSINFHSLKQLNVQFLDVSELISIDYKDLIFNKISTKMLGYLFNPFEDAIYIDVDIIPFIKLEEMFKFLEYERRGAYFFQDRQVDYFHKSNKTIEFFNQLLPNENDFNELGIQLPTKHTLQNRFFTGWSEFADVGIFLINKRKHYNIPLMTITLALSNEIKSYLRNEKELYWLAMSISGDEIYSFNRQFPGAIGELLPKKKSHFPNNPFSSEICTIHKAHLYPDIITDELNLLWMSTGFKHCKYDTYDSKHPLYKDWTEAKFKEFNNNEPLKIRHVIIPPIRIHEYEDIEQTELEPLKAWIKKDYCNGLTYCAYNMINGIEGDLIKFKKKDIEFFDELGIIWMKANDLYKLVI